LILFLSFFTLQCQFFSISTSSFNSSYFFLTNSSIYNHAGSNLKILELSRLLPLVLSNNGQWSDLHLGKSVIVHLLYWLSHYKLPKNLSSNANWVQFDQVKFLLCSSFLNKLKSSKKLLNFLLALPWKFTPHFSCLIFLALMSPQIT
jgi:hypothetical protein